MHPIQAMVEKKPKEIKKNQPLIKGGARPGAGRKKGSPNKKTAELQKAVEDSGLTPLDYMLSVMRNPLEEATTRIDAAKAAAPYVHAKLSSIEMEAKITIKTLAQELAELNDESDAAGD